MLNRKRHFTTTAWVLAFLLLLGCSPGTGKKTDTASDKEPTKIESKRKIVKGTYPIINGAGYLIGGTVDGVWKTPDEMASYLDTPLVYKLYTTEKLIGEFDGSVPKQQEGYTVWYEVDLKEKGTGKTPEFSKQEPQKYDEFFSRVIGLPAVWNPMIRPAAIHINESDTYTKMVREYLLNEGLDISSPVIRQVIKADLDGDGTQETLINAGNIDFPVEPVFSRDSYAVIFIEKIIAGKPVYIPVQQSIYIQDISPDDSIPCASYISSVMDVNGDEYLDIIVENKFYEGESTEIYEWADSNEIVNVFDK